MAKKRSAPIPPPEQIYNDLLEQSLINYNAQNQGLPIGAMGMGGSLPPPPTDPTMLAEYNRFVNSTAPVGALPPPPTDPAMLAEYNRFVNSTVPVGALPPPPTIQYPTNQASNIPPAQIPNIPTTATSQIPPVPPVGLPSILPTQQPRARPIPPTFRDAMAMQTYNNFMQQQLNALATNRINESMQMPTQQIPTSNKAAENYASLIPGQMNQQTTTAAPKMPTIPGMQQPSGFGSSQTENTSRQRQPRTGFGYLPKNEIAPIGY
jgi:hypothetical protein